MPKINTYLNFDGKSEEAFNFYKSVFGGEFLLSTVCPICPVPSSLPMMKKADLCTFRFRLEKMMY